MNSQRKKFSQNYSETKSTKSFLIATLFSLPLQKLFLKFVQGYSSYSIDVIFERYFDLPALFTFLILSEKWVNKWRLWEEKEM